MSVEVVYDDISSERYDELAQGFEKDVRSGEPVEDIEKRYLGYANRAEELGNMDRLTEFLLMAKWARTWIDNENERIGQGKAVSDRMAAESLHRQHVKGASLDVLDAWREGGHNRPQPTHAQLQLRRYGEDGVARLAEHRSKQSTSPEL